MVSSRSEYCWIERVILARHADGDQIHQAFFRLRILFQNLQIQRRGFVELPQQLQRNRFAEERGFHGPAVRASTLSKQPIAGSGFSWCSRQMPRPSCASSRCGSVSSALLKESVASCQRPGLFVTDAQVEVGGGVLGRHAEQLLVGLDGVVELLQLKLDVALGGQNLSRFLAVLDGGVHLAQGFLALAFQMQSDRARQGGGSHLAVHRRRPVVFLRALIVYQLPFVVGIS